MESHIIKAVGIWFYSVDTTRYLYLLRNDNRHPNSWGLPGGKQEPGETLWCTISRECQEELGHMPEFRQLTPLEKFTSHDNGFEYHTFWASVTSEFIPKLNDEHLGWAWIQSGQWPRPMHPGLWNIINIDVLKHKIISMEHSHDTVTY